MPDDPTVFVDAVETILRRALAPIVSQLRTLETALADVPAMRDRVAALEARTFAAVERQL